MERDGFILDREPRFFTEHTEDELITLGFSTLQLKGIRECLAGHQLSLKESEVKAPAPAPVVEAPVVNKR